MIPQLLEVLDTAVLVSPVTAIQRQLVLLNNREVYVVCYHHNDHSIYTTGKFFISESASKAFFDLQAIDADLTKELTDEQANEYAKFKPLDMITMLAYLPR